MRFAEIKTSKYTQNDLEHKFDPSRNPLVEFQTKIQFKILEEQKRLGCLIVVIINILETKEKFAELKVENLFEINPFYEVVIKKEENKFEVSDSVMMQLATSSVSTVRGILHEKLKGTIAQNEVYPLIDVSKFNKENQE